TLDAGREHPVLVGTPRETLVLALTGSSPLDSRIDVRIRGLIESPVVRRRCRFCEREGASRPGEFGCGKCRESGSSDAVCARHVVVLKGAYSQTGLQVSCPEHVPPCTTCSTRADFWCGGPLCRSRKPWCSNHRKAHTNSPEVGYCAPCYDALFPR